MTKRLFCFGLGYTALTLIDHLKATAEDWRFAGTCRDANKQTSLKNQAIDCFGFDSDEAAKADFEAIRQALEQSTHILVSAAPSEEDGDPVLAHFTQDLMGLKNLPWLGYLSTTAVYGDQQGGWVDEDTALTPTTERGHARVKSEQAWLDLVRVNALPVHIFRLGSIYGSARGQLHSLLKGRLQKLVKKDQVFSRIHVEDIARILQASMAAPHAGQCYNVVDDLPAPSEDVIDYICDLLGKDPLPALDYDKAELSPMMKSFYSENKRVRNDRLRQELKITLRYPTYKQGFSHLVKSLVQ